MSSMIMSGMHPTQIRVFKMEEDLVHFPFVPFLRHGLLPSLALLFTHLLLHDIMNSRPNCLSLSSAKQGGAAPRASESTFVLLLSHGKRGLLGIFVGRRRSKGHSSWLGKRFNASTLAKDIMTWSYTSSVCDT